MLFRSLQPDPEKVKAITEMPALTDKQSIQRLLGMTNHLQKFALRLSEITTPLRELSKNDSSPGRDKEDPIYDSSPKIL